MRAIRGLALSSRCAAPTHEYRRERHRVDGSVAAPRGVRRAAALAWIADLPKGGMHAHSCEQVAADQSANAHIVSCSPERRDHVAGNRRPDGWPLTAGWVAKLAAPRPHSVGWVSATRGARARRPRGRRRAARHAAAALARRWLPRRRGARATPPRVRGGHRGRPRTAPRRGQRGRSPAGANSRAASATESIGVSGPR